MSMLTQNLQAVHQRIHGACQLAGREPVSVGLICVSKTQPASAVQAAFEAGERHFGENYVQEALEKIQLLAGLRAQLHWHFIGPLQSNKSREVAEHFDWVHSVDSLKLAQRLSSQRPAALPPLQICLQVNISAQASKRGVNPAEAMALARAVHELPRLRLRGLMSIPAPGDNQAHPAMATLLRQLVAAGLPLDTLSLGMSDDLEAAVAAGATWVRIGTALFGHRPPPGGVSQ
jgi:PLP dependent protein